MTVNQLMTTGFMGLLSAVSIWAGTKLEKISDNMAEMNAKLAVVLTMQTQQKEINNDFLARINRLEQKY